MADMLVFSFVRNSGTLEDVLVINLELYKPHFREMTTWWGNSEFHSIYKEVWKTDSSKSDTLVNRFRALISEVGKKAKKPKQPRKRAKVSESEVTAVDISASGEQRGPPRTVTKRAHSGKESGSSSRKKPTICCGDTAMDIESSVIIDAVTELNLPKPERDGTIDLERLEEYFKNYELKYGEYYPFGIQTKVSIDVRKVRRAPNSMKVRAYEEKGMKVVKSQLQTTHNPHKQVLCICPIEPDSGVDIPLKRKPTTWEEIQSMDFFAINGQHSVEAAKELIADPRFKRGEAMKIWEAVVVWAPPGSDFVLQSISRYYNEANKINPWKPSWVANIIHARLIWVDMGKPAWKRANKTAETAAEILAKEKWTVCLNQDGHVDLF
jgi:hypothetical protein